MRCSWIRSTPSASTRFAEVFPDSVENNDGIVHAVTDYGQQSRDEHQIYFKVQSTTKDRENRQGYQYIMYQCDDGAGTIPERFGKFPECP